MTNPYPFSHSLSDAIGVFLPVLRCLEVKNENNVERPAGISLFPILRDIKSICGWEIIILKGDLSGKVAKAQLIVAEKDPSDSEGFKCYIVLDKFFYDFENQKENRITIAVHEFIHILAYIYGRINTTKSEFLKALRKRLSGRIDDLNSEQIVELRQFFDKLSPSGDFTRSNQTNDNHFRLGIENMSLDYADLYKNLLLSRQLFDEYFSDNDKTRFSNLWVSGDYGGAKQLYEDIANHVADEEWLTKNFAIHQAYRLLERDYAYDIL